MKCFYTAIDSCNVTFEILILIIVIMFLFLPGIHVHEDHLEEIR